MSDQLAWFEKRLPLYLAGLLTDEDNDRFEKLVEQDAQCKSAFEEFEEDANLEDGGHLPAAMIARWDRANESLRGLERRAVMDHLAQCTNCKEDLETLGFEPVLGRSGVKAEYDEMPSIYQRMNSWWKGITVGALGGAAVTAAVLALAFGLGRQPTLPGDSGVIPWVAPSTLRGERPTRVEVHPGTTEISVMLGVPRQFDKTREVELTIAAPDGETMVTQVLTPAQLRRNTVVVALRTGRPLALGEYEVLMGQPAADGEPIAVTSRFEIGESSP